MLKAGEELTIGISEEAETLEEQLKELEGYGSLYDLYPCGENTILARSMLVYPVPVRLK